ncbi:MAG: carboxylesterase/lipase family protein [Acidimicrobiales bacterium]
MSPDVQTTHGTLRGVARESHCAFIGVPFAAPPDGPRRFLAPGPLDSWDGARDAVAAGPAAPQDPFVPSSFRAQGSESEDCLYLNVFTPAPDGRRRPVLFWIHGGGFSHGSGTQRHYDGGPLAERGDVVVVTINYRLGALGYLYLGAHGGDAWGAAPNGGQLDQIAALRWVHDNIEAFGGDPDNVTIFGQSAGSAAVCTLVAMPGARGLFAKAIAQSGTANRLGGVDEAAAVTTAYLDRLGITEPDQVRTADVSAVLQAQGARGALRPMVDDDTLPHQPLAAVRSGFAADIPLMVGTARDEQKLYVAPDRPDIDETELERQVRSQLPRRAADRAGEAVAVYRDSRRARGLPADNHDIVDAVTTASRFRIPGIGLCEAQAEHQPHTFLYQFDWESPARRGTLGACHGLEIPFVFGSIGRTGDDRMSGTGPDADRLSGQMMDAWIAFARTGDPSHDGIGRWPAYGRDDRHTMVFGRDTAVQRAPFEEERALWESMIASRTTA